ncbi:MAG: hypothetical protein QM758_29650 [Armatimonas sp.]
MKKTILRIAIAACSIVAAIHLLNLAAMGLMFGGMPTRQHRQLESLSDEAIYRMQQNYKLSVELSLIMVPLASFLSVRLKKAGK